MTRQFARYVLPLGVVALLVLGATAQGVDILDQVQSASHGLTSYAATIQMTQYKGHTQSTIEFSFDFVPPDRMRIVYTEPASVKGQTMILNTGNFYTYLPSLDRQVWQDVKSGGNDQGKEMGFLYNFVTHGAKAFIDANSVEISPQTSSYTIATTKQLIETVELEFTLPTGKQIARINTADGTPVSIDIYNGDKLAMEVRVLDYSLDKPIDSSLFQIPEKR